jgi:N6-adenosine-specific RNA methylase IME4/ParB-like chromosome segregation protein Spo0J
MSRPRQLDRLAFLPPLGPEDSAALKRSLELSGVLQSVLVSAGPAGRGVVVDGRERERICAELGVDCPRELRRYVSEAAIALERLSLNVHRRKLSQGQLIELALRLEPLEREAAAGRRAQAKGKRRGVKSVPVVLPEEKGETRERLAAAVGLKAATFARGAKVLKEGSPKLRQALLAGEETVGSAARKLKAEQRRAEVKRIAAQLDALPPKPPSGRFEVVLLDPPWPVEFEVPYPKLSMPEIRALPIKRLLAKDAVVWLWIVDSLLEESLELVTAWGLSRRATLTWAKDKVGTGHYLRGQTEHCWLLTKGKPVLRSGSQSTLLHGKVREHSRKPDEFYELVESLCPGRKLELFAREPRKGWTVWGAETDKFKPKKGQ